jgi:electron transport complex protein RnfA
MNETDLWSIFVNASLINNFVLAYFLGICPFLGVSGKLNTASRMGASVTFVMLVASVCTYFIHDLLLLINAPYLQLISYIVVIASTVQIVEMFIKKTSPALFRALGIFLPLITTNCAILGLALFQTNRGYNFIECIVYALGAGIGFTLALVLMAGLREKLDLANVPELAQGTAVALILAGILSLSFMGFAGLGT